MTYPIFDLHCDLLSSVESQKPPYNFDKAETCCSISQMRNGGVKAQCFVIFVTTAEESTQSANRQLALYQRMLRQYYQTIRPIRDNTEVFSGLNSMLAIENASALASESDKLEQAFQNFDVFSEIDKVFYISLTWNQENRFGGGCMSPIGLKADGEALLEYLSGKGTAIDLSHASDALAEDIFNTIDKKQLDLSVIASHSNFREVWNHKRNLPTTIAKEIIYRKGLIGINAVSDFLGRSPEAFNKHVQFGLELGAEDSLALGMDFYGDIDIPAHLSSGIVDPFFEELGNSSTYPYLISLLEKKFTKEQIEKITYLNSHSFYVRQHAGRTHKKDVAGRQCEWEQEIFNAEAQRNAEGELVQ
jgi:membrane dipeptidase